MVVGDRSQTGDDKHRERKGEDGYDAPGFCYLDITAFIDVFAGVSQGLHLADKTWEDQICRVKSQNEGKYAIEDQDNG